MSKKNLLNEATIRRFMKLADLKPLTSPFVERLDELHGAMSGDELEHTQPGVRGARKGDEAYVNEDEEDEPGARDYMKEADDAEKLDDTERELSDMDAEADRERDEMDDMEGEMDAMEDGDIPADVRDRIESALASALEDLADKLDLDLDVEREDDAAPEMDAEPMADVEIDVDDDDDEVEVDAMLERIEVVEDTALISEVAKRVTARLVKAMAKK